MRTMKFSEARRNLKSVCDQVVRDASETIITRKDGDVIILSLETYNSMKETAYLMQSPKNAERLLKAVRDVEAGNVEEHGLLEA